MLYPAGARAVPPSNDNFANATLLTGNSGNVSVSILDATRETNEPTGPDQCAKGTAWYKWVAPAPGELLVTSGGSDPLFNGFSCASIYVGTSVDALSTVAGRFFTQAVGIHVLVYQETVQVQPGETYYIQTSAAPGQFDPHPTPDAGFFYSFTQPPDNLVAAVLPSARSVNVGTIATGYGTLINTSSNALLGCYMALPSGVPAAFEFRATDAANNFTAAANETVSVPAGGVQNFVFGITPSAPITSQDIRLIFDCQGTAPAVSVPGLNTFLLSASTDPVPDMVAIAATTTNDGIVNIPGITGTHVFATASVNIGASGTLTATVDDNGRNLALQATLCQTNPTTGVCINPQTPGSSATVTVATNSIATFTAFITGIDNVPFDPANNRLFMRFKTADGVTRGATSVAVRTK
jgi:hypothetical protein